MDGTGICTTCGASTDEQKEMCPDCEPETPAATEETEAEPEE